MPGLPLHNHDSALCRDNGCGFGSPRSADQTCCQQPRAQSSPDEQLNPEESFALYCKPVELYNVIQQRAIENPPWLQRCLRYKIDAKRKKRIQITISLSGSTNADLKAHCIFPLHVLLSRPTSNVLFEGHSQIYRFSKACLLTSFSESGSNDHTKATFNIPDLKSLAASKACNLNIILVSCGQGGKSLSENCSENSVEYSSPQKLGGRCFWGNIPIDLLGSSLENCVNLSLGRTMEFTANVSMSPGFLEPTFLVHDSCFTFCSRKADATGSYELQASIVAQEAGGEDIYESPYGCYSYNDVPLSSLPHIIRLRTGNVLFNYRYCKNMQRSEVTEDFSCSLCLLQCSSFKGLECHLTSSHDLFHFEFWVSKDYQAVNVSLKTDTRTELLVAGDNPGDRIFSYRSRFKRCRRLETTTEKIRHVHPHIMEAGLPENIVHVHRQILESGSPEKVGHLHAHTMESGSLEDAQEGSEVEYVPKENESGSPEDAQEGSEVDYVPENGISVAQASIDSAHPLDGSNHSPPTVLQFGKTRKLSVDRADPRNRLLLQKREFFHSHKAQRMEQEEVFADHDSEDEVDDDIADYEDRRMLDDFIDVTKDEKHIMHMWNSFVRKQRDGKNSLEHLQEKLYFPRYTKFSGILADDHIPWACEAFSRQHGQQLVHNPALLRCWRFFMIKLWNHSLLDARTMNTCNNILDSLKKESSDPEQILS